MDSCRFLLVLWKQYILLLLVLLLDLYKLGQAFSWVAEKVGLITPETYNSVLEDAVLKNNGNVTKDLGNATAEAFKDAYSASNQTTNL